MNIKVMWDLVCTIIDLSSRGDKWVGKREDGKIIMIDEGRFKISKGMRVPVSIYKETKTCCFGHIDTGIWINSRGAYIPIETNFNDKEVIQREASLIKQGWDWNEEEHRRKVREYEIRRQGWKEKVEELLDLDSRKYTSSYMSCVTKKVSRSLTQEELEVVRAYFELPPWGVTDRDSYIITDSYTD